MPEPLQYSILTPSLDWIIPKYSIVSTLPVDYSFCGSIEFIVLYNGVRLGLGTSPMAFRPNSRSIRLYSNSRADLGKKTVSITPYLSMYPQIRGETISTSFEFTFNPCPYEQLQIDPENQLITPRIDAWFLQPDQTHEFDLETSVLRSSDNECGSFKIEFSMFGRELPPEIFSADQSSLTIKSQAVNSPIKTGKYIVDYAIYLEEFPTVRLEELEITVTILNPCKNRDSVPSICKAKDFMPFTLPQWFTDLDDFVFQLGQESRYDMGEAVDSYGQPIEIDVTFSD